MELIPLVGEYLAFAQACLLAVAGAYCLKLEAHAPLPSRQWQLLCAFFFAMAASCASLVLSTCLSMDILVSIAVHMRMAAFCVLAGYGATLPMPGGWSGPGVALLGIAVYFAFFTLGLPMDIVQILFALAGGLSALVHLLYRAMDRERTPGRDCPWRLCTAAFVAFAAAQPVLAAQFSRALPDDALHTLLLLRALPALLALAAAFCLTARLERVLDKQGSQPVPWWLSTQAGTLALTVVLALGFAVPFAGSRLVSNNLSRQLLMRVQAAGRALAPDWVVTLNGHPEDVHAPIYQKLLGQLNAIRLANTDLRFVYLVGRQAGTPVILLDTEPPHSPDYAPPGEIYTEAPHELRQALRGHRTLLTAPYTDRWGTWISGFTPIQNVSGRTFAVLGMDIEAANFQHAVGGTRLGGIGFVLMACGLIPAFLGVCRRNRKLQDAARELKDAFEARSRAQAGQERSEEQYRTLVEKAYDGMALVRDGSVLYANPRFASMVGLASGEMAGRPIYDFVPGYRGTMESAHDRKGEDGKYETHIRSTGSEDILAEIRSTIVVYRNRAADLVSVRDVTRLRRNEKLLREAQARSSLLFTQHPLPMVLYDTSSGIVTDANPAATSLYGYTREEMQTLSIMDIATSCHLTSPTAGAGAPGARRTDAGIEWHTGKSGVPFPVETSTGIFDLSGSETACMAVRSAMRRVEHVRAERETRKAAQHMVARYREVLQFIGHAMLEIVRSAGLEGGSGPSSISLHLLADTIKALVRSPSQNPELVDMDPLSPMRTAKERMDNLLAQRGIRVKVLPFHTANGDAAQAPPSITSDPALLHLVLANILRSASTLCSGCQITMQVQTTDAPPSLAYTVSVCGDALAPAELTSIFDLNRAQQTGKATRAGEALGIAQLLAGNMGAHIRLSTGRGEAGTDFILEVPHNGMGTLPHPMLDADGPAGVAPPEPTPRESAPQPESTTQHATAPEERIMEKDVSGNEVDLALWNRRGIIERLEIDEDFLLDLCAMFRASAPGLMRDITAHLAEGELEYAAQKAHALKNECMNVGSDLCRDLSEQLVRAGRQGQTEEARRLAAELADAVGRLLDILPGEA